MYEFDYELEDRLPRPTSTPSEVADRLQGFVHQDSEHNSVTM